jgi:DNA-binding transcriptional MerR regulator
MDDLKHIVRLLEKQGKQLSKIEKILESQQNNVTPSAKTKSKSKESEKYNGLIKAIFDLIKDSFFDEPKELKTIMEQMKANAVFYPRTSYPKPLLRLIKNKHLRRIKENNKWKYVKY